MAGFTINSAKGILQNPGAAKEFKTTEIATPSLEKGNTEFANVLSKAVNEVNDLQQTADVKIQKLATGQTNNIPDVMMAVEKADIAMKLMMSVRNKMIDAYQEIMKMQV